MSERMEISFTCCLCSAGYKDSVAIKPGWAVPHYGIDASETDFFCPDHADVQPFQDSQCPGCVGGWGDCPMWSAFSSSYSRDITPGDLASIRKGICPRRVNGTIGVSRRGVEDINLSDRAPDAAGEAFARAIEDYCRRYPVRT